MKKAAHRAAFLFPTTSRSSAQAPIGLPSVRRTTTVAERAGSVLPVVRLLGQAPFGCWMLTKNVFRSGVQVRPVISQPFGPTRKRLDSFVVGSTAYIALLPKVLVMLLPVPASVCTHSRPCGSTPTPSGLEKVSPLMSPLRLAAVKRGSPARAK